MSAKYVPKPNFVTIRSVRASECETYKLQHFLFTQLDNRAQIKVLSVQSLGVSELSETETFSQFGG